MLLSAYEAQMRNGAKDEAGWRRLDAQFRAEPTEVKQERRRLTREAIMAGKEAPARVGMSVDDAEALMARFAASEKQYSR